MYFGVLCREFLGVGGFYEDFVMILERVLG